MFLMLLAFLLRVYFFSQYATVSRPTACQIRLVYFCEASMSGADNIVFIFTQEEKRETTEVELERWKRIGSIFL